MKKFKSLSLLPIIILLVGTGCLKDRGYDNNNYGINDPDASPTGVGFNQGTQKVVNTGLTLSDESQPLDTAAVLISLFSGNPAPTDIHVTVTVDNSLVDAYNAANGTSLITLDPSLYSFTSNVIIPMGARNAAVPITVPNTTSLDPNNNYGLGLRIVSADAGYLVGSSANQIVLSIAIRNQYDGAYHSNGYLYHPSAPRAIVNLAKTLTTINATTVKCPLGDLGASGYAAFFDVDPITNHVTVTTATGAAGGTYVQFDDGLPTSNPGYTAQWPRSSECNNTYDPATQEFKMRYGYVGGTGYRVSEEIIKRD